MTFDLRQLKLAGRNRDYSYDRPTDKPLRLPRGMRSRNQQILELIARAPRTAKELAELVCCDRKLMTILLCGMVTDGRLARAGTRPSDLSRGPAEVVLYGRGPRFPV